MDSYSENGELRGGRNSQTKRSSTKSSPTEELYSNIKN